MKPIQITIPGDIARTLLLVVRDYAANVLPAREASGDYTESSAPYIGQLQWFARYLDHKIRDAG